MFTNRPAMKKEAPSQVQLGPTRPAELEKDFILIREAVQNKILLTASNDLTSDMELLGSKIEESFNQVLEEKNILYNHAARTQMLAWVMAEMTGYGPIEPLLHDEDITEIMVNGYDQVYVPHCFSYWKKGR